MGFKTKAYAWGGGIAALAATFYGHGIWPSDCIVLQGDGWQKPPCSAPGAVPADSVVASGDTGAKGYGAALSPDEIKAIWVKHGGDPGQAHIAQAVARAESNGRPRAANDTNKNGSSDYGLWQINTIHRCGPKNRGRCWEDVTGHPWDAVFDPEVNTMFAVFLQREQGWEPWSTYSYGKKPYRKYL